MHKIDASGHANNNFVDEDLLNGTSGTRLDAAWLNSIQNEIIAVLQSANIQPDKANTAQLTQAISVIIAATNTGITQQQLTAAISAIDLSGFSLSNHAHSWNAINNKPATFPPVAHNHNWASVAGKPATFPPSNHRHIHVVAYASSITGTNRVVATRALVNGNYIYTNPLNIGKQYKGIAVIKYGEAVPTTSNSYVWEEIPGRIRVTLADFAGVPTSVLGSKILSESVNNFNKIIITAINQNNTGSRSAYTNMTINPAKWAHKYLILVASVGSSYNEGLVFLGGRNTSLSLQQTYHAELVSVVGVR